MLFGYHGSEIKPLRLAELLSFRTQDHQVVAKSRAVTYRVKPRIYQLAGMLPNNFIQISSGEIVNFDYVDHLEIARNGIIKLVFKNQQFTFVSRRYIPVIRKKLGI